MSHLIALYGPKRCGKDSFFQIVKEAFPEIKFGRIAFADPIKDHVMEVFNLRSDEEYEIFKESRLTFNPKPGTGIEVSGRHIVRSIGMNMRRITHAQVYWDHVQNTVKASPDVQVWVLTDLRFPDEMGWITNQNLWKTTTVCRINREGCNFDGHASEQDWMPPALVTYAFDNHVKEDYISSATSMMSYHFKSLKLL